MNDQEPTSSTSFRSVSINSGVGNDRGRNTEAACQVRQNNGRKFVNDGKGIYLRKVYLEKDDLDNIKMVNSDTAGIVTKRPYNPNSKLISLDELINDGSTFGTNLVMMILSILAKSRDSVTLFQQKIQWH